ncbi:MAG: cellulase family glycosylhydrolase, partial [Puniceicoccales bacterium]|jgi:hypothetical protein|nr:cellulase family glycosylhydrolase [Puniceicoccales bacterium]
VRVKDGHFATDAGRIRFWGTNTCFAANFTTHENADKIAARLARFGINCVRLHHMDAYHIWSASGEPKTKMTMDKAQLDKLDYFVAALKKRGIYINLNLHVSRVLDERDGFPPVQHRTEHDKGIDNFYRPFIAANKKYARDLLTHVNPYTGKAYKDEPSVAMIEMNNENSIVSMWCGWGGLEVIRDPFLAALRREWNQWLTKKYGTDTALKAAWKTRSEAEGRELLAHAGFPSGYLPAHDGWSLEMDSGAQAALSNTGGILRIDVKKKGEKDWQPQLVGSGFSVEKKRIYTLRVRMRASRATTASIGVRMNHAPWEGLGFGAELPLAKEWKEFRFIVQPTLDDSVARVAISRLHAGVTYEIDTVSLKPGGHFGMDAGESLKTGTVGVFWKRETSARTKEAVDDFCDFLLDIEGSYWDEMRAFVKKEIGAKQPVSGTQLEYGGVFAQARMDYCDIHAYWNHPSFPGRAWDTGNWFLRNRALVNELEHEILPTLATKRIAGKPYTVSEYNHPWPNQYAAEGLPLLAAFGAFQDWDGIFPFAYLHSDAIEPRTASSFFDTAGNTVQMAHMIACRALLNSNVVARQSVTLPFAPAQEREILRRWRNPYQFSFGGLGADSRLALTGRTALKTVDKPERAATPPSGLGKPQKTPTQWPLRFEARDGSAMIFSKTDHGGTVSAFTADAGLFTGFVSVPGEAVPLLARRSGGAASAPSMALRFTQKPNLGWATVTLARIAPGRYLLTATGEMRNTGMVLQKLEADKVTVGRNWGTPPILCEGIAAQLEVGGAAPGQLRCWALDESGNRRSEVPIAREGEKTFFAITPAYKTIWYEVEAN